MSYPDNNPKTLVGSKKVPLHLIPPSAKHFLAMALEDGGKKYGPYNWRDEPISVSTYYSAGQRHWDAFWDGEDNAQDSQIHHLAHAMACCALLLDAMTVGKLVDDRPTKGAASKLQLEYYNKKEVTPIGEVRTVTSKEFDRIIAEGNRTREARGGGYYTVRPGPAKQTGD